MTNPLAAAAAARAKAQAEPPPETVEQAPPRLHVVTDADPLDAAEAHARAAANAEAQERALQAAVDQYVAMLPEIEAARPIPAQTNADTAEPQLTGAAWVADGVLRMLTPPQGKVAAVDVRTREGDVKAEVAFHPGVDADNRLRVGNQLADMLRRRGNLGEFEVGHGPNDTVLLYRLGIEGPGSWRSHGTRAGAFQAGRDGQRRVFDNAGLVQKNKVTGSLQYPLVHSWGADDRGGTCELRLPPGMILDQVRKAEPGLRQALNAPDLEVTSRGVWPVLHLNTKSIAADFPKVNMMPPTLFVRPRTEAERHAAASSFVLPLGVRGDGSPILVPQAATPHMAVFGGTGSGKTTLVSSLVDAACVQGASVLLADGRAGSDMRRIALSGRNGVIGYCAGSSATLHRAVQFAHDEYRRRQALQDLIQRAGKEYQPIPLVLFFDEWGSWLHTLNGGTKEQKAAAEVTRTRMEQLAAEARELKVFVVLVGQHAYVSALPGELRGNLKTQVVVGRPDDKHLAALFADQRAAAKKVRDGINPNIKGRSLVADVSEEGDMTISMFQGFFNPPGPAADAMEAAVAAAPRPRRVAWRFPLPGEEGGDGSWQDWTPVSEPRSDSLPVVLLDLPDGRPDPAAAMFDPTSSEYRPGRKPLSNVHAI